MKKTGELLKKSREEKGLSLHEIGLSLKINSKILKQIEDGELDNLPAKTFLRGFVQSYAQFLKLNSDDVLKLFSEEMGSTKPKSININTSSELRDNPLTVNEPSSTINPKGKTQDASSSTKSKFELKNIGIGAIVFILLISLIGIRKVVEKYQKEAEVETPKLTDEALKTLPQPPPNASIDNKVPPENSEPTQPKEASNSNALNNSNKPTNSNSANSNLKVSAQPNTPATTATAPTNAPSNAPTNTQSNPQTVTVPPPTTPPQNLGAAQQKVNEPAPALKNTAQTNSNTLKNVANPTDPKLQKTPNTTTTENNKLPTDNKPAINNTGGTPKPAVGSTSSSESGNVAQTTPNVAKPIIKNLEIVIEALDNVELEITSSTGKIEKMKLSALQTQTIKTTSGSKINVSNGGAVNLTVNGKDMGVPGDLGKPKRISF